VTWWRERMCAFDFETTAAEPEDARIVTSAIALCSGGERTETETWLADPGVEIPEEAAGIHGITTEHARAHGRPAVEVIVEVRDTLVMAHQLGMPWVVFNAPYDFTVLDRECRRHRVETLTDFVHPNDWRVIDPLCIDKWLDRYRKGSRKLEAMCAHYGAPLGGAHDAAFDAIAAARGAWVLGARARVVRKYDGERRECEGVWEQAKSSLYMLMEAQRWWAREQRFGLAAYFRAEGKIEEAERCRVEWPMVPA
jgi:DNA polymerase III epsilon subunit-like protein